MPTNYWNGSKTEVELNTHELAWAAGFFDGEGWSGISIINKDWNPRLKVSIGQNDRRSLDRFKRAVLYNGRINYSSGIFRYQTQNFEHSQAVLCLIWKYLGEIKRKQYKLTIRKYFEFYDKRKIEEKPKNNISWNPKYKPNNKEYIQEAGR